MKPFISCPQWSYYFIFMLLRLQKVNYILCLLGLGYSLLFLGSKSKLHGVSSYWTWWSMVTLVSCEAQGKGRAKGRLRKVTQRSFKDYRLSIIDIDFPRAYIKFDYHPPTTGNLLISGIKLIMARIIGWGIRFKLQMLCPQEDV